MGFSSRKFLLTILVELTGIVALFTRHLTGPEFITIATLALGMYKVANVIEKKVTNGQT